MKRSATLAVVVALAAVAADARAFEPEEPSPPAPAPFIEPPAPQPGAFGDLRLAVSYGAGHVATGAHGSGPVRSAASLHLDYVWSSRLSGLLWAVGLEAGFAKSDLAHPGSTLYLLDPSLSIGYGIAVDYNFQVELLPYVELIATAVDRPFSSSIAWGTGAGGGAKVALTYTFDAGVQLSAAGGGSLRWFHLSGDCASCASPQYSDQVTMAVGRATLAIGKRF